MRTALSRPGLSPQVPGRWDLNGLRRAAEALRAGSLVAFPTETVYGLGANAFDAEAVRAIYRVKGRPADNPLIVHVAHPNQIEGITGPVPPMATRLIERFMPGPLTLVLKRGAILPAYVSAGLDTVAVRCPSHPVAQALISMAGVPVAAPSANLSTRPSPTRAAHVVQDLDGKIPFIIDGGDCRVGLESTVVDVTGAHPVLLRPGTITAAQIEEVCGTGLAARNPDGPVRAPGMKYRHYAPRAQVLIGNGKTSAARIRKTLELVQRQVETGRKVGVFASVDAVERANGLKGPVALVAALSFGHAEDTEHAAKRLFDALRALDDLGAEVIVVQALPEQGIGTAFMNRVMKAADPEDERDA